MARFAGVSVKDVPTIRLLEPVEGDVIKYKYEGDFSKITE